MYKGHDIETSLLSPQVPAGAEVLANSWRVRVYAQAIPGISYVTHYRTAGLRAWPRGPRDSWPRAALTRLMC